MEKATLSRNANNIKRAAGAAVKKENRLLQHEIDKSKHESREAANRETALTAELEKKENELTKQKRKNAALLSTIQKQDAVIKDQALQEPAPPITFQGQQGTLLGPHEGYHQRAYGGP